MQSTGQGATQSSQPLQSDASTPCIRFGAPTIASTGHAWMHSVQPMHVRSSMRAICKGPGSPRDVSSGGGASRPSNRASATISVSPPGGQQRSMSFVFAAMASAYGRHPNRTRSACIVSGGAGRRLVGKVGRAWHGGAILASGAAIARQYRHDHSLHAHDGDAHEHYVPAGAARRLRGLGAALALTGGFAIVEAVGGWLAGSLALLSDAGHMATDAAALGLALFANGRRAGRRLPRASYGYARAEALAAFVNALALLLLVAFIVVEAISRSLIRCLLRGERCWAIAAVGLRSTSAPPGRCPVRRRPRPARTARCCTSSPMRWDRSPQSSRAP